MNFNYLSSTAPEAAQAKTLARKAMLVKLTSSRPTTARREKAAEQVVRGQLGDASLTLSSHIFAGRNNPVRKVINEAGAVYSYHMAHTLAWQDRGPRILPVAAYEDYSREMRSLVSAMELQVAALAPYYSVYVDGDITARMDAAYAAGRTPRARSEFATEYPTYDEFKARMKFEFLFTPMPDESHFLFDLDTDDKAAFKAQLEQTEAAAKEELTARIREPLLHLIEKLRVNIGTPGAIFRDSAVENIVDECRIAESLAMGDESLLAMIQEVRTAVRPHVMAMSQLRDSPTVRASAADKLAAVASRMSFLMGGDAPVAESGEAE